MAHPRLPERSIRKKLLDPIRLTTDDEPGALNPGQVQIYKELSYWRSHAKVPVGQGLPV
ncbi:hypothetical protein AUP68_06804 [Ilyonectria robusta]